MKSLSGQRGLLRLCAATVFGEDIADSKSRQWSAAVVPKERFTIVERNLPFRKKGFDDFRSLRPKRTDAFFATLSKKPDMERSLQLKIAGLEIDYLLHTRTGVKHGYQENVITPAIG
jgi:hypothetical protein